MSEVVLKVHGSGNTFFLIEAKEERDDWAELARWLCLQEQDGGADGLLIVLPSTVADAKMRVINADGSEASMCGNGLRCVARFVLDQRQLNEAVIETMKANLQVTRQGELVEGIDAFAVEIAPISFALSSLPMTYNNEQELIDTVISDFSETLRFTAISVPNPHLIAVVTKEYIDDPSHQQQLATYLNGENPFTPDGVNVSYILPISSHEIFVRTYERGVGFTNACGTAMTASSYVARLLNLVDEDIITVYNPGGMVKCHVKVKDGKTALSLIGNGTYVKQYSFTTTAPFSLTEVAVFEEQALYEQRMKSIQNINL